MSIAGALIGAGGSLLGGIFGRKQPKVDPRQIAKQIEGQALGARQAGEKYGFNPLALLGLPVDVGAASSNPAAFGRAIADAALTIGENVDNTARDAENSKLRQANARLQERVQRLTLRKPVPGVYQRNGDANRSVASSGVGGGGDAGSGGASTHQDWQPPVSSSDQSAAPPRAPLMFLGGPLRPRANSSDAEAIETRYGEYAAEAFGATNLVYDVAMGALDPYMPITKARRAAPGEQRRRMEMRKPYYNQRFDPNNRDGYYYAH